MGNDLVGGRSPSLAVLMAEALAAQVDFYDDIRAGDCVGAVFSADERPDGSYKLVSLEAVRLDGSKKSQEAYRFSADGARDDWYDADGQSLKRRFLRSPLKFTRVSSRFGVRMHPILRRPRNHDGVDYVAPVGTPVQASGDGVVRFAEARRIRLHVELKHGKDYVHLVTPTCRGSRAAFGRGRGFSQGQVVGYVGSTGMSTGAHLHYRFIKEAGMWIRSRPTFRRDPAGRAAARQLRDRPRRLARPDRRRSRRLACRNTRGGWRTLGRGRDSEKDAAPRLAERALGLAALAGLAFAVAEGRRWPDWTRRHPPGVPVSSKIVVDPPIPAALRATDGVGRSGRNNATVLSRTRAPLSAPASR